MITQEMIARALEMVVDIHIPENFGIGGDSEYEIEDISALETQLFQLGYRNFDVRNGVSKAVIIFDNLPFVIKIPFNGSWEYEYNYDDENDEWVSEPASRSFYYFSEARAYDISDYCWNEYDKIKFAQHFGYGDLFPDIAQIYEDEYGRHFYIQEKVQPADSYHGNKVSENSINREKDLDKKYKACDSAWRASVIEFYGENFWISFVNWNDSGERGYLDDMYSANYGYRFDGAPVLIDVSGFYD